MHILFLTDNFPPEVNAPASRTFEHARQWVRAGHRVTVITCAPNFPKGVVFPGYRNRLFQREAMDGISVIRVWTYMTANEGVLRRSLDYASFMVTAVPAGLAVRDVDVVVATSPQLFTACAGYLTRLLKRRPFVFELRDLWPDSIKAVGAVRSSRLLAILEGLELFLYRRAAHIVCVTQAFTDNLVGRGVPRAKLSVAMNGADLSRFSPRPRDVELAAQLGLAGQFVVGYVGTHGLAHGLGTLLDAAEMLQADRSAQSIRILFLGDGAEKTALKADAHRRGLNNVLFIDSVPRNDVVRYWSLIDVSVIHLRKAPLFQTVIPSKLFECMAMGIPVLHGVAGESAEIVRREQIGAVFPPEDGRALADLVLQFARDPARRAACRAHAQDAVRRYDRTATAMTMLATLERVVAQHAGAQAAVAAPSRGDASTR